MRFLHRSFKTEIDPSAAQKIKIHQTIGVCRFLYNFYLAENRARYEAGEKFMSARDFSVWLNNEYLPAHPEKLWIKEVSSKSVKKSLENAYTAFRRFFSGQSDYPNFKKKGVSDPKMYFVKNNPKDCRCERHRIRIPTLGWVKLKEKGYLPPTKSGLVIRSGTVSMKAGRYFVSVLVEAADPIFGPPKSEGLGIDLGLKYFAVFSSGQKYKNINKTLRVQALEKQLRRAGRRLSRKYENQKKGGATQRKNLHKQQRKVQTLHARLANIRTDALNKVIAAAVKIKPSYIAIEDLNVSGMMKNKHLAKAIAAQKFYEFRSKLIAKGRIHGIEIRLVDRWFPSSKRCHGCGQIHKDLKLSDRIFRCSCGYTEDRDVNASLNLCDTNAYRIA